MSENIEFIDQKERELFARAALSQQTLDFMASPVGRYLHGRAKAEVEQAQVDALEINPFSWWGRRKWRKLQHRADVARSFIKWCADAITDGEVAYQELKEYRGTEE